MSHMHRRQFLYTATLAAAAPMTIIPARAAEVATPASGDTSLADRVAAVAPEALLEALLTTPVTTPLIPADLAGVTASAWDDTNDSDLAGAVGGVSFEESGGSGVLVANVIVQPDADTARTMMGDVPGDAIASEFLGMPWMTLVDGDYAVSALQVGYVLMVGGSEAPYDPDATPDAAASGKLQMRAIDNMVMLVDHLDDVLTALGA